MHLGRVLPQTGGQHVLCLLDGDAIDVVDDLAHRVIAQPMWFARQRKIVACEIQAGRDDQIAGGSEEQIDDDFSEDTKGQGTRHEVPVLAPH